MNLSHFRDHDEGYTVTCKCAERFGDDSCDPLVDDLGQLYPGGCCLRCLQEMEGYFTCAGCGQRVNADDGGGGGDDLLSLACSTCVVRTWGALAATAQAIARGRAPGGAS